MLLSNGESKGQFKERLQREGRWEAFAALREQLKARGVPPCEAWQQAAEDFLAAATVPADQGKDDAAPVVDCWFVLGSVGATRTQQMLAAFPDRPVFVLDASNQFPAKVAGFEFVGVLPAAAEFQDDAEQIVKHLQEVMAGGKVRLFGSFRDS